MLFNWICHLNQFQNGLNHIVVVCFTQSQNEETSSSSLSLTFFSILSLSPPFSMSVCPVSKQPHTHTLVNSTAIKHGPKLYRLWQCLCQLVSFICHCWHGQSYRCNGNSTSSITWKYHRGAFICYLAVYWMDWISFSYIECRRVRNSYCPWTAKPKH